MFLLIYSNTQEKKPEKDMYKSGGILEIGIGENGQSYSYFICVIQIFMKEYNVC